MKENCLYDVEEIDLVLETGEHQRDFKLSYSDAEKAKWIGIAAVEAFFGWTEHVLILVDILLGKLKTGDDVSAMAGKKWPEQVKFIFDLSADAEMKSIYEELLEIRGQVRNEMAHGGFGKQGEAFSFNSGAGSVPVKLDGQLGGVSAWIRPSFEESRAIEVMEAFIAKLWQGERAPAKVLMDDDQLPIILSHSSDGLYRKVVSSEENMKAYTKHFGTAG